MRKLALFAAMGTSLLLNSGCARWTLRPMNSQRDGQAHEMPDKLGALSKLMGSQASQSSSEAVVDPALDRAPQAGLDRLPPDLAKARLNERQGDEREAEQIYKDFIAKHPNNPVPYHRLGVMAARKSKHDEAEQYLSKALELPPPSPELLGDMGYLCYLQSRFDDAERYLLQALEQSPDNTAATNNLALVYGARGDFDKSLRYFNRVNDDAKSHANVAFTMTQQGRLEDARSEYLAALSIDKTLRSAANALVQIETKRKAAEQAAKRSGRMPASPTEQGGIIELSSAMSPRSSHEDGAVPQIAKFEPVARPRPVPTAATPQFESSPIRPEMVNEPGASNSRLAEAPQASPADQLMPLPKLPETENMDYQPIASHVERPSAKPTEMTDDLRGNPAGQFSRFSTQASVTESLPTPPVQSENTNAQVADIFRHARQVGWNEDVGKKVSSEEQRRFENIPIPASEPDSGISTSLTDANRANAATSSKIQQAVAIEPVKAAASSVRPTVHIGLSDENEPAPAKAEPKPVRSQFSDFGTAPARLNVTTPAGPLSMQR